MIVKHSAPGPYLGFALQPVRLCYHLLNSPESASVSLEVLDDIAIHFADGGLLLEQCKSALSHNALSDWSEDLWKTLGNWLDLLTSGKIDVFKTSFQLYVTPPKTGKVSSAMHLASKPEDVRAIIQLVKGKLKARKRPPECINHVQKFLDATEAHQNALIIGFRIVSNDNDPVEPLRGLLAPTIPSASIDVICESAIGMVKERADRYIRSHEPAIICAADFRKIFHTFIQKNNLLGYLTSFSTRLASDKIETILQSCPTFIKQLQLIDVSQDQQLRAVCDYMRTIGDKVKWAEQGLIFEDSFDEWEETLLRRHAAIQGELKDTFPNKDNVIQGRTTYNRCSVLDVPLESRVVPGHFTHGGFNDLANRKKLGWHVEYKTLLNKE